MEVNIMSRGTYIGESDIAKKVSKIYLGVNNISRKIKSGYIGDENGIAQKIFPSEYVWNRYEAIYNPAVYMYYWDQYTSIFTTVTGGRGSYPAWSGSKLFYKNYSISNGAFSLTGIIYVDYNYIGNDLPFYSRNSSTSIREFFGKNYDEEIAYYRDIVLKGQQGAYIGEVSSNSPSAYPSNNFSGNYWYVYKRQVIVSEAYYSQGNYIDQVKGESSTDYPDNGYQNGYYYVLQN